ncbi:MAG TPA: ABC transporter permease, partial [Vicinamibacteria bacterium]|nr:ABC transporter permease [Vicinamibacteria bacterium]
MIASALLQDLRFALRGLAKSPGFTLVAVISIAIGIGANTAIFSVANALLLRPLPYADPERLVILWNRSPGLNIAEDWFSTAQYFDIRNGHSGFEQVAIAIGGNQNLTGPFEPERVGVLRVSSNLLPMLGAKAALGRLFVPEEDGPGRTGTVVLNHGTWKRRYGGDPAVIGRVLNLNGAPSEVVGVLPEGFSLPREVLPTLGTAEDGEMFLPLPLPKEAATNRGQEDYNVIAKLKPGVTAAEAQVEMDAITRRLRADHPDVYPPNGGLTFGIVPLLDQVVGNVRPTLFVLAGSVAFVLLIACANVANLLLSRALSREKEIAVRVSVGASSRRLAFQLLVESLTLSLLGGVLGVALSFAAVQWIHLVQPKNVPRLDGIAVNGEVLLFTTLLCLIAGVLFGLAPALGARHVNPGETLVAAGRGSTSANPVFGRGNNLRRLLVVAQVALSMVLLVGAGLLVRSFARLQNVAPGFDPSGVLTLELTLTGPRYAEAQVVRDTYRDLWKRLEALPGVISAGGVTSLPLSGYFAWGPITIEGRTPPPGENFINADQRVASGRYFEALGIPLLKGRFFNADDTADKDRVIIIDEFMADQYWP